MDFESIQRGDSYIHVYDTLEIIISKSLNICSEKEQYEELKLHNSKFAIQLIDKLVYVSLFTEDKDSLNQNWKDDIEPKPIKLDSRQAFRVPSKQNQQKKKEKIIVVPAKKIKQAVDINTLLTKELLEEKKILQREYINQHSQLNFLAKGSSPQRFMNQTISNMKLYKPWDLSYAHFNANNQQQLEQILRQTQSEIQLEDKQEQGNSKFFIRKILAKESVKRATEKAEQELRERKINPQDIEELEEQNRLMRKTLFGFRARSNENLQSEQLDGKDNGETKQNEEQQEVELTDFFTTQIKQEGEQKITDAYFRTIRAASPNSVKPFDLRQKFPKAFIPKLIEVPKQLIKIKFQKDQIQQMEENATKKGSPSKLDEAMIKKMKNIRVRSNSPQRDMRYCENVTPRTQLHLKDNVQYLINPELKKQEEEKNKNPKILPELDFKQVTKFKFTNRNIMN